MSVTFTGIRTIQPRGPFYTTVMSAKDLLSICKFDYRKLKEGSSGEEFMGIQRPWNDKRVEEIARYTRTIDACFPTSIVISVDERCVEIADETADITAVEIKEYRDVDDEEGSIPLSESAWIIDGQHRLKGLESGEADGFQLPVTVFIGADEATRAAIFSVVNLSQTRVNSSVVYDLFAVAKERSPQKSAHTVAVALDKLDYSPFYERIMRLGARTPGRDLEFLSQATVVRGILKYLSRDVVADREASMRRKPLPKVSEADAQRLIFRPFFERHDDDAILDVMMNYFSAIAEKWEEAWHSTERGVMIGRTNGYDGFIRFLGPAYRTLESEGGEPSKEDFRAVFDRSSLKSKDFVVGQFPPGSSGASALAHRLANDTGISL